MSGLRRWQNWAAFLVMYAVVNFARKRIPQINQILDA